MPPENEYDDLVTRLAALRAERGYLLPHHGLLAALAPDVLAAYGTLYRALTLGKRHLGDFAKEFVWLAILAATDEAAATHHVAKFRAAGGLSCARASNAKVNARSAIASRIGGTTPRSGDKIPLNIARQTRLSGWVAPASV